MEAYYKSKSCFYLCLIRGRYIGRWMGLTFDVYIIASGEMVVGKI